MNKWTDEERKEFLVGLGLGLIFTVLMGATL